MAGVQIAMSYEAVEDRILMRHRAGDKDVRLWLTRRMAQQWLQASARILEHVQGGQAQPPAQRRAVAQFNRESAVQGTDFKKPYREPAPEEALTPWPAAGPLLAAKLTLTAHKDGRIDLIFSGAGEKPEQVKIGVSQRELHGLTHMLTMTAEKGRWGLADPNAVPTRSPGPPQRAN